MHGSFPTKVKILPRVRGEKGVDPRVGGKFWGRKGELNYFRGLGISDGRHLERQSIIGIFGMSLRRVGGEKRWGGVVGELGGFVEIDLLGHDKTK